MKNILKKLLITTLLVAGIGFAFKPLDLPQVFAAVIPRPVATFQTSLASGISASDTTMSLVSLTTQDGTTLEDGVVYGFTLDEGTSSQEYVIGTVETSNNTVISMTRGVSVITGSTSIDALKKVHRRGDSVKITDHPVLTVIARIFNGIDTIPNAIKYASGIGPIVADDLADKEYVDSVAIAGGANASTTVKGISKLSVAPVSPTDPIAAGTNDPRIPTQNENDALVGTSGTAVSTSNKLVDNSDTSGTGLVVRTSLLPGFAFGGSGTDGVLNVTSGTTTIDLGGLKTVTKNYTSINVSLGATLNFSNPHSQGTVIILKSQSAVTIAGTLDASGMGSIAGTAGSGGAGYIAGVGGGNNGVVGNDGSDNDEILDTNAHFGGGGNRGLSATTGGTAKTGPVAFTTTGVGRLYSVLDANNSYRKSVYLVPGTGGGGGGGGGSPSGSSTPVGGAGGNGGGGGRGGAALYIECNGAWNFTGSISVNGLNGAAATAGASATGGNLGTGGAGGGGGGGGAGMFYALYKTLTANSGTVTATGGTGGNGNIQGVNYTGTGSSGSGGASGGAGGSSILGAGGNGGAGGNSDTAASGGTSATGVGGAGGTIGLAGTNGTDAVGSGLGGSNFWGGRGGGGGGGAGGAYVITSI
jgi:hypothetical protein